jgi:hypothetical protein
MVGPSARPCSHAGVPRRSDSKVFQGLACRHGLFQPTRPGPHPGPAVPVVVAVFHTARPHSRFRGLLCVAPHGAPATLRRITFSDTLNRELLDRASSRQSLSQPLRTRPTPAPGVAGVVPIPDRFGRAQGTLARKALLRGTAQPKISSRESVDLYGLLDACNDTRHFFLSESFSLALKPFDFLLDLEICLAHGDLGESGDPSPHDADNDQRSFTECIDLRCLAHRWRKVSQPSMQETDHRDSKT